MTNHELSSSPSELVQGGSVLAVQRHRLTVPDRTRELLYMSTEDPSTASFGPSISVSIDIFGGSFEVHEIPPSEPSTIFVNMPVSEPRTPDDVARPGYYPTYHGLTPQQKWIYLNWLRDISAPVQIGYVFIYYYGLERQLLLGKFDAAFDEILYLRRHHQNRSFQSYSRSALLNSCIFKKRPDRLEEVYGLLDMANIGNLELLFAHRLGFDLSSGNLIGLATGIRGVNRRYIRKESEAFEAALDRCLSSRYGDSHLPFASQYRVGDLPRVRHVLFANISFPQDVRTPEMPSFPEHAPFTDAVRAVLAEAHEATKLMLRERRKEERKRAKAVG